MRKEYFRKKDKRFKEPRYPYMNLEGSISSAFMCLWRNFRNVVTPLFIRLEWNGTSMPARGVVAIPRFSILPLRGVLGILGRILETVSLM